MPSVYYVDAIPGHEEAVSAELEKLPEVSKVTLVTRGNFDIAILVDLDEPDERSRWETNKLRRVSGAPQFEHVEDPSPKLLKQLEA